MLILIPELKSSLESHPPPLDSLEPPPIPRKKATIVFKSEAVGKTEQGNTKPMLQSFNIQSYAAGKSFPLVQPSSIAQEQIVSLSS